MANYIDAETFEKSSNQAIADLHETIITLRARIMTLEKETEEKKVDLSQQKKDVMIQKKAFESGLKLLNESNEELISLRKQIKYYEENIHLVWKRRIKPEKLIEEKEEKVEGIRIFGKGWQQSLVAIADSREQENIKHKKLKDKYDELKDVNENMSISDSMKQEIDNKFIELQKELDLAREDVKFLRKNGNDEAVWTQRLRDTGRKKRRSLRDQIIINKE
tara:strand:+ start:6442 stop:7101 length:660 start_codon:yes stop_codon:yes gene_type:complete